MKLLLFFFLSSQIAWGTIYTDKNYSFPADDGLLSSLAGNLFEHHLTKDDFIPIPVSPLLVNENYLKNITKRNRKKFTFYYRAPETKSHSLVFIHSGIGGDGEGPLALLLTEYLNNHGHHVLIVPSIFTKQFVESCSLTGFPGDMPADAKDLINAKNIALNLLKRDHFLNVTDFSMIGYSLGALTAAHIGKVSIEEEGAFDFKKIVMINPPVDLLFGLGTLDNMLLKELSYNSWKKIKLWYKLSKTFSWSKKSYPPSLSTYQNLSKQLEKYHQHEIELIVGKSLSSSLEDVKKASLKRKNIYIESASEELKQKFKNLPRNEIVKSDSFVSYVEGILVPYFRNFTTKVDYSAETLNEESSLSALRDYIANNDQVFLMHNQNDFLLREHSDWDFLQDLVRSENIFLYPFGGHTGNLWFETNRLDIENIFSR
jgi:hypothetical protein